ncbi:MAG: HEAT repeat domain-containing protein [Bacteroidales bacterium]|nr:HEAT repeat domain-containing protein [Bacteroidales bacterium]
MKKLIKIFLIIILSIIAIISIYLYLTRLAWQGLSAEDKLTTLESIYRKCQTRGGEDCELEIADRLNDVIGTQKIELIQIIQDKNKLEENRIFALSMFFGLSRGDNQLITIQESDFYYSIAIENENPFDLRQLAYSYSLDTQIDDEKIIALQEQMIIDPNVHPDFKRMALGNISTINTEGLENALFANLINSDSGVRLEVANALGRIGGQEQISELVRIALDETNNLTSRSLVLLIIEDIVNKNIINNTDELVRALEPLLEHNEYTIRVAVSDVLESLTGKVQEIKATQEEIDDYISNTFLSDY